MAPHKKKRAALPYRFVLIKNRWWFSKTETYNKSSKFYFLTIFKPIKLIEIPRWSIFHILPCHQKSIVLFHHKRIQKLHNQVEYHLEQQVQTIGSSLKSQIGRNKLT